MPFQLFQPLFDQIDAALIGTVATGSANMIALISPIMASAFSIYVLLICFSYWRGSNEEPLMDFFKRMMAWGAILTFGMNAGYYASTVIPFFTNIGNDISGAMTGSPTAANAIDSLGQQFINLILDNEEAAHGIVENIVAVYTNAAILIVSTIFMAVAAAYIVMAKIALTILLAMGPLFISLLLFPATRKFFDAWVGQCVNYVFLTVMINFFGMFQINFYKQILTNAPDGPLAMFVCYQIVGAGIVFILVTLQIPSLASALAGGVGISTLVGKFMPGAAGALTKKLGGGGKGSTGGQITGKG